MSRRDERGMTAVELTVATAVLGLVLGAFWTVWGGFMRDVGVQDTIGAAARDSRPVMRSLVIELRQAVTATDDVSDPLIDTLAWNRLIFFSDRNNDDAPEKYDYQLTSCSSGVCQLSRKVFQATNSAAPFTYPSTTTDTEIVLRNVSASSASGNELFRGRTPPDPDDFVTSCSTAGTDCDFPILVIDLRVDPNLTQSAPRMFELHEEVRFRNAQ